VRIPVAVKSFLLPFLVSFFLLAIITPTFQPKKSVKEPKTEPQKAANA
jgi:hypothetical protein